MTRPDIIDARLSALERNTSLYDAGNLASRAVALDAIQQVYQLLRLHRHDASWGRYQETLRRQAHALEKRLREADAEYFETLQHQIRNGEQSAQTLRELFDRHTRYRPGRLGQVHRGYDALDALIQGLIRAEETPVTDQPRHIDMIHYEPTPARAVLDLIDQVRLNADDVFYDLGAGLGHVTILVHLLTTAVARGVEIEAAYCEHARRCAEELGLPNGRFLNCDVRHADVSDGTVFFMYTPFTGEILQTVLAALERQAQQRPITVCTYGASTFELAKQAWLHLSHPEAEHAYAIAVFKS